MGCLSYEILVYYVLALIRLKDFTYLYTVVEMHFGKDTTQYTLYNFRESSLPVVVAQPDEKLARKPKKGCLLCISVVKQSRVLGSYA